MAYTVTITYNGVEKTVDRICAPVCRIFTPNNSYADTPVYKCGYPVDAEKDEKTYGKSVYATNVPGWGRVDVPEPYKTTAIPFPVPMTQFKLAVVGEDNTVTFDVDTYSEAFYYMQVGAALADQGFTVEVSDSSSSDSDSDDSDDSEDDSEASSTSDDGDGC